MESLFYLHGSLAVLAMSFAMFTKNTIHALLYAVFSLLCLAVSLYAISAPLAAALEVIIYAGAIMVLFVFAVMLLEAPSNSSLPPQKKRRLALALLTFAIFWAELVFVLKDGFTRGYSQEKSVKDIAVALFSSYGFLLEMVSFVLLAGLTSAIFVGRNFIARASKARV